MKFLLLLALTCSYACNMMEKEVDGECIHKDIWPPHILELTSYIIFFIICNLTNAVGIGGGGILVPLLVILQGFPAHNAIPLSKSIILGGAIVSFIMNLKTRSYLINFKVVSVVQPFLLLGTSVGVILNKLFPDWIIIILLSFALSYILYKNYKKAILLYKKETQEIEKEKKLNDVKNNDASESEIELASKSNNDSNVVLLENSRKKTRSATNNILMIIITYVVVLFFALFKGSSEIESIIGIEQCSSEYFALLAFFGLYCVLASLISYNFAKDEISWGFLRLICYSIVAFFGGIGTGMLGLGGGAIISPLLLETGLSPEMTAASSGLIVLFTSSTSSFQFFLNDMLNIPYAAFLLFISMFSSITGVTMMVHLVKKYKRPSIIVFGLAIAITLSAIVLLLYSYLELNFDDGFHKIC